MFCLEKCLQKHNFNNIARKINCFFQNVITVINKFYKIPRRFNINIRILKMLLIRILYL